MAKLSVFICGLYVLVLTSYSMAMTEDQKALIHQQFHKIAVTCIKDNPISDDDIAGIKTGQVTSSAGVPCFLACIWRTAGVLDDNGMLQNEHAMEQVKQVFTDPEEQKNIENYLHSCAHINNEPVTDGNKGCERALLSYKCMVANAAQFGFAV